MSTIAAYPQAGPLDGTELFPMFQNGRQVVILASLLASANAVRDANAVANAAVLAAAAAAASEADVLAKVQAVAAAAATVTQTAAQVAAMLQQINTTLGTINAEATQVATQAGSTQADRQQADRSALQATGAAMAVAEGKFFPSNAAANASLATLANGSVIQVAPDETRNGHRIFYLVQNGALNFAFDASPAAMTKQERADLFALLTADGLFANFLGA